MAPKKNTCVNQGLQYDNFKKMNTRKPKETARDRHLKWINHYSSKNFGIWVECTDCKKWRRTFQYSESHEVPENWCCSRLTLENGKKGSCNDPEEEQDEPYLDYSPGSVVWAKLEGYPWWPGMVDGDPITDEFSWRVNDTVSYNVTFLDKKPTHAWVVDKFICPFSNPLKVGKGSLQKLRQNRYAKAISKAKERAETAMKMTIKDRLQTYSFVHVYKGHWPAATNSEECNNEENGSKKVEYNSHFLLKNRADLKSFTTTDDKRMEKDLNENNMTEEGKLISKNSDIPSSEKETHQTKYLNNEVFIPNKVLFPFMKKKKSKKSSSVNKALSNAKYQALVESIINPIQEKESKGIKMKTNEKLKTRKQKNLEKQTRSLNKDIIAESDSEHESSEILDTVIVPKVDKSKTIHDSEEKFVAEGNKNYLPEILDYDKHKPTKKSNNVLNEKEFNKEKNIPTETSIDSSDLPSKEEMFKHIDESNSKILESVENESLDGFDEYNHTEEEEIVKTSNVPPKKSAKQKKSQNSRENINQSNNKTENLEENITLPSQVPAETKMLQNVSDSTSKIKKQPITVTNKLTKKSRKKFIPVGNEINELSKKPKKISISFVIRPPDQNKEVVVGTGTAGNMNKKRKH